MGSIPIAGKLGILLMTKAESLQSEITQEEVIFDTASRRKILGLRKQLAIEEKKNEQDAISGIKQV